LRGALGSKKRLLHDSAALKSHSFSIMAIAGGTPPTGVTPKPKREWTPIQKFGLPLVGLLALAVGFTVVKPMLSGNSVPTSPAPAAPTSAAKVPASVIPKPAAPGVPGVAPLGASPSVVAVNTSPIGFIAKARVDPFEPVLLYPPALPPLPPAPPAPRIKPTPPPVTLPSPSDFSGNRVVTISDPRVQAEVSQPLGLGSPTIKRTSDGAPRDAFPPARTSGVAGEGGAGAPQASYDKRLAGVIIGDGVHALLEITANGQVTTQVVQPGDEVNGVRVLSIERFRDGERTVTRMLVRDTNGTQQYVELKPSAQPPAGGVGGPGGAGRGFPGAAGFPGGGGFPGAGGG